MEHVFHFVVIGELKVILIQNITMGTQNHEGLVSISFIIFTSSPFQGLAYDLSACHSVDFSF
jgi:hypothetical protein